MASVFRFGGAVAHWVMVGTKYHPAMARKGSVLVLASAVLTLAACSSSDGEATPPTSSTPATIATTTAPTTTSTPPTTQASTTTIDPAVALAAEVEADFREADRLGREASMDPFDPEKEAAALDRRLGVIAENFAAKLAEWRELNYALRENPDVPASITVIGAPVFLGPSGDVAELQVCEVNSWILVEVGAGPDGADAVIDPDIVTYRNEFLLREIEGTWRIEGANELGVFEGAAECSAG